MPRRRSPNAISPRRAGAHGPPGPPLGSPAALSPGLKLAALRHDPRPLPPPLEAHGLHLFREFATAVARGAEALGLRPGDEVLMPAYHRGSEVDALLRSGIRCRFYDATDSLAPESGRLESLLGPEVRALHLIHHLGFTQDAATWRRWCDERGLLLIEDAGEALMSTHDGLAAGSSGHLALFALQHPFGLPHGATYVVREPQRAEGAESGGTADRVVPDRSAQANRIVRLLLPRLIDPGVPARRRANYRVLLEELGGQAPPPFDSLPPGACPVGFPVETDAAAALIERLRRRGIRARLRWAASHPSMPDTAFPRATARRARTVILPVHQGLRPEELDRAIDGAGAPRARGRDLELERVERFEDAPSAWPVLAARSGNVFATPEWAETWWRHFGRGRPLAIVAARDLGTTVSVLPLYVSAARPAREIRFIGHGPADHLGPVCAPEDTLPAARALRRAIASPGVGCDILIGDYLSGDAGWSALLGGRTTSRQSSPVLSIAGRTWEDVLSSWSSNFRQQVRRRERRLAREHEIRFRLADDPDRLERDLTTLITLHHARWGRRSSSFAGPLEAFHREFAALALARGWLRLWFLLVDETPVAAWYGFRFEGSESFYQSGRDPAWDRASVGLVLMAHTIREAAGDGVQEYRFLNGDEAYKTRFASADPGVETIAVACSLRGRAVMDGRRVGAWTAGLPAFARSAMGAGRDGGEGAE